VLEKCEGLGNTDGDAQRQDAFITGASRGIGLAIALRAARDGAQYRDRRQNGRADAEAGGHHLHRRQGIEAAGGKALPIVCDIRFEDQVQAAVAKTVETFGGLDICVNNASAISLTPSTATDMKRYDLMHGINARHLPGVQDLHPAPRKRPTRTS
jgi:citronellol/citronellal dehydrogenase